MKNKTIRNCAIVSLCLLLTGCNGNVATTTHKTVKENTKEEILSQTIESTLNTNTDKNEKNEVVYVFTNSNGTKDHVLVSNTLKSGKKEINDKSSLKDIENVSGDETFSTNNDEIIWKSKGKDITYQGTTDKTLPIDMKITYTLDGKDISLEELKGKSGHLTMRYDYTNNTLENVSVDGKNYQVKVPFTVVTGMILPEDVFTNVEITNGKLSEVSGNNIALGITMPGLKDNLSIDVDIPEYFEVSSDVKDFKLDMCMSMATCNFLSDVNVDDLTLDKLKDKMNELQDASNQLVAGSEKLQAGTQTLADNVPALKNGIQQLDNASSLLQNACIQLYEGSKDLNDKMGLFDSKFTELYDTLKNNQLDKNINKLSNGANQLDQGVNQLLTTLNDNMNKANALYNQYYKDSYNYIVEAKVKETALALYTKDHGETIDNNIYSQYIASVKGNDAIMQEIHTQLSKVGISETPDISNTNQLSAISAGLMKVYSSQANDEVLKNVTTKVATLNQASATYKTLYQSYTSIKQGGLKEGMQQLKDGLNMLETSVGSFDGYKEGTLCSSLYSLKEASHQLLNQGTSVLNENLGLLAGKTGELKNGTSTLVDASNTLASGVIELNEGAITLKDGMATFNEKGIESLSKLVNNDGQNIINNIKAIVKAGQEYQTFTGKNTDMKGSVMFIYKIKD